MPSAAVFDRLGLFIRPAFLDAEQCAMLSGTMAGARSVKGTVSREDNDTDLDESVRRVRCVDVGARAWTTVRDRLQTIRADVAASFDCSLDGCDGPDFLAYDVGGFYTPHQDNGVRYRARRVSLVLFLNTSEYAGGELTFHGLMPDEPWSRCPLPLDPTPGLLVAFPSGLRHEVRPVRSGCRHTIAAWFTDHTAHP